MRTMAQPGPLQEPRILVETAEAGQNLIIDLPEGSDLLNGLRDAVQRAGASGAAVELLGGNLDRLHYFTGMPDPTGRRHFVGETPWAHLDIASVSDTEKTSVTQARGATGFGVRSVTEALRGLARKKL